MILNWKHSCYSKINYFILCVCVIHECVHMCLHEFEPQGRLRCDSSAPTPIFLSKTGPGGELSNEEETSRIVIPKDPSVSSYPALGLQVQLRTHLAFLYVLGTEYRSSRIHRNGAVFPGCTSSYGTQNPLRNIGSKS